MAQVLPLPLSPQAGAGPWQPEPRLRKPAFVHWDDAYDELAEKWEPGQHASVIAPTGRGGKTHFITRGLMPLWTDYRAIYIDIKDHDETLWGHRGTREGPFFQHRVHRFPSRLRVEAASQPKWFHLHIRSGLAGQSLREQQAIVYDALARAYKQRDWLIVGDELAFLSNDLHLTAALRDLWKRGRSNVTFIAATQSPRWVPGEMFDQPRFLFLGRLGAEGNKRLGEIGGTLNYKAVQSALSGVKRRQFLIVDREEEEPETSMFVTGL